MEITGPRVRLVGVAAEVRTNARFAGRPLPIPDRCYLPAELAAGSGLAPLEDRWFVEDDHRSAIRPDPVATLGGQEYYLSVKGIGSTTEPFSERSFGAADLPPPRETAASTSPGADPSGDIRLITGELWLRGSPYGGQGLPHALTALAVSERASPVGIHGFLVAPVVKIAFLPPDLEERLRAKYWYRRYPGRYVQELRLVPSNVRIYFHARSTVGQDVGAVFDRFGIGSDARALAFEVNFARTGLAMLTLFARTLEPDGTTGRYRGLDFHDVWLDKDAVVAPDGSVFFVDLEGIEPVAVDGAGVREKIEDQVYRSLYEFMFAFEQVESERRRRFGATGDRREHFLDVVREALREDPYARPRVTPAGLDLEIRNPLAEEPLYTHFRLVDR